MKLGTTIFNVLVLPTYVMNAMFMYVIYDRCTFVYEIVLCGIFGKGYLVKSLVSVISFPSTTLKISM